MIRVAVVAEVTLHREGVAELLRQQEALVVAGVAGTCEEGVALVLSASADVALVDFSMSRAEHIVRAMARAAPNAKIVALGVANVDADVIRAIEAGASGYVLQDASIDKLLSVIRSVVSGQIICPPEITLGLARRLSTLAAERPIARQPTLSFREAEIAVLAAKGLTNKEIARAKGTAVATVKNQVHRIFQKLGVDNRTDLAARLSRDVRSWIPPPEGRN